MLIPHLRFTCGRMARWGDRPCGGPRPQISGDARRKPPLPRGPRRHQPNSSPSKARARPASPDDARARPRRRRAGLAYSRSASSGCRRGDRGGRRKVAYDRNMAADRPGRQSVARFGTKPPLAEWLLRCRRPHTSAMSVDVRFWVGEGRRVGDGPRRRLGAGSFCSTSRVPRASPTPDLVHSVA
jgi:hypothetical protein